MSEMFTKCNGFIVSGDPLVYADSATMTGQGTVSEPFGVKSTDLYVQEPLYTGTSGNSAYIGWRPDETVLWQNNGSFSAKGLTAGFNEPASAFERLMFVCGTDVQNYNCLQVEYHPGSACLNWTEFYSNTFRYWNTQLNLGENGMTAGAGYIIGWSYPNGTAFAKVGNTDWEHCYKGIKKVIGINRKV